MLMSPIADGLEYRHQCFTKVGKMVLDFRRNTRIFASYNQTVGF